MMFNCQDSLGSLQLVQLVLEGFPERANSGPCTYHQCMQTMWQIPGMLRVQFTPLGQIAGTAFPQLGLLSKMKPAVAKPLSHLAAVVQWMSSYFT